ncbi:cytochrome c oxidase assembly protein COX18, mitochondrial isoform X1 [Schistocerca piceifrons]|uniref:cytochrome c oxidase assembly protein COX18, mitochondrial isoform X1 n=1 Tax=Schistocerca piceifrons TaxID=274613 RepID=UPI001F5F6883|nr:cytochrome c oxidase assembly protein COX18, mitochondrial isoform X1 [Schistocerca piceifrons]
MKLPVSPIVDKMFSRYSNFCVSKVKSAALNRAYSVCANRSYSGVELDHLHQEKKCGLFLFSMGRNKCCQRRSLSSQFSPEIAPHPPMVLKFLSESSPVLFAQENLVLLHDLTCLPWWATIISSTIILRTAVTLPLAVYQNHVLARYENILQEMPAIVKELKAETAYAVKKFQWTEKQARVVYNRSLRKQLKKLIIRDNCHPAKASLLVWVQIPMWICLSASLRNLVYMLPQHSVGAEINFVQLTKEGLLWFSDLTLPDSAFILPLIFGMTNLAIVEVEHLQREWIVQCQRKDKVNVKTARVCSAHFRPEYYERDLRNELLGLPSRKKLLPTAIPCINIPNWHGEEIVESGDANEKIVSLSKVKTPGKLQKFITNFFRVLTIGMTAIATQVPSCLTVYWVTSSFYGLVQNIVLMSPRVKKFFRIPETPSQLKHPYMHIYKRLREKVDKLFTFGTQVSKEK